MHILEMTAENIKRIKTIKITPKDNVVVIEGKNAAGKTSALDCIAYALGGKKFIPDNPIRNGEETAFVEMTIGDYKISRNWTKKGTYLKLENKEGFKSKNPQQMLDAIIGDLSFDPMKFCDYKKTDRLDVLKKICNLDFADLEKTYKSNFEERTFLNRQLKELDAQIKPYENLEHAPKENMRTIQEVETERDKLSDENTEIKNARFMTERHRNNIKDQNEEIYRLENRIKGCKESIQNSTDHILEIDPIGGKEINDLSGLTKEVEKITIYKETEAKYQIYQDMNKKKSDTEGKINGIEKQLDIAKQEKETRIKNANMPIEGLGLSVNDVSFNGIDFSEISSAQKIKISMAIAMALNPRIKIIRILNGSLLDSNAMKEIETLAKEKDFQIWIERVSDKKSDDCIYIEEGEIK